MQSDTETFLRNGGRAAGGALIFSLPLLMTMEMWWLGLHMDELRLAVFILVAVPMLTALSHVIGFERTSRWRDDAVDALLALGIGLAIGAAVLAVLGVIRPQIAPEAVVKQVALQSVPAAIGALLARSQFGDASPGDEASRADAAPYAGELFLGLNLAPTDEMVLIAAQMTSWHAIVVVLVSLAVMHGFVYAVGFKGGSELSPEFSGSAAFVRFTLPGYVLAALISLYVLWIFGRTDDSSMASVLMAMTVLGFPCSLGAAAARLII